MSEFREPIHRQVTYSAAKAWRERHGRYRLVGSKCAACGALYFPRRVSCPSCQSRDMNTYECVQTGTVAVLWPQVTMLRMVGFADLPPRYVCIVRLDDGVELETELVDVTPEQAQVGLRVRLMFRRLRRDGNGTELYGYKFAPLEG